MGGRRKTDRVDQYPGLRTRDRGKKGFMASELKELTLNSIESDIFSTMRAESCRGYIPNKSLRVG